MMNIHELAGISGVSVRTLHYYDKIDLLKPCCTEQNGYRKYNEDSILRLQQIMYYKEMDLPLKQIQQIMNQPDFDQKSAIRHQKELLTAKRNRLNRLIEQMEQILKGDNDMDFSVFEHKELEEVYRSRFEQMDEYFRQSFIKEHGSIDAFIEHAMKNAAKIKASAVKHYGSFDKYIEYLKQAPMPKEGMGKLQMELEDIIRQIAAFREEEVSDPKVQKLVEDWKKTAQEIFRMSDTAMDITETFRKFYQGYTNNEELIKIMDKSYGEGSAVFLGKAMKYNDTGRS